MPNRSPKVRSEPANVVEIATGRPAKASWRGRLRLLEAFDGWDRHLRQQLEDFVVRPDPLTRKPFRGVLRPGESGQEMLQRRAVELLKQKTNSDGGYLLYVLDVGEPSRAPEIASDGWIETIQSKEVLLSTSQITRHHRVFAVWVGERPLEPAKVPAERAERRVNAGGRPFKYPWHEFWIEVARIADRSPDELPEQRVLKKQMLGWVSEKWRDQPAANTVGDKLVKLYRALLGRKRGRPLKFGWDGFWIEVIRIANTPDGLPDKPELIKHMFEWVSKDWINQPAENTMRAEISGLYRALGRR